MKRILYVLAFVALLASCNKEAIYTTRPCRIDINLEQKNVTASYAIAEFTPQNVSTYYYADVVPMERFKGIKDEQRFMQLCVDSLYRDYINWRYEYLVKSEKYIANFANHCLCYGSDSRYFKDLNPENDYVLFAFCVNPETNQPIGQLYSLPFRTSVLKRSDMTFQVMFLEREDGTYVSVVPSDDDENFVWEWEDKDYFSENKITVEEYAEYLKKTYKEYGMGEYMYSKGSQSYKCQPGDLEDGHEYIVLAIGYDGEWTTKVFTHEFSYPFEGEGPYDLK